MITCSFCGKMSTRDVVILIGPQVNICNECVEVCCFALFEIGHPVDMTYPSEYCDGDGILLIVSTKTIKTIHK